MTRRASWPTIALVWLVTAAAAAALPLTSSRASASNRSAPPTPARPCGTAARRPAVWKHVVWIVMENKAYDQVIGSSDAPYVNALAQRCGLATNFHAETTPSLPNYIALTSGSTQGITDDADPSAHRLAVPSIFSQLGNGWRVLADSMPAPCVHADSGLYAVRHNPATYYTGLARACSRQDTPLGKRPDLSARFTLVVPNICHDMHSCPTSGDDAGAQTRTGDTWLAKFLPLVLGSSQYKAGATAVFVTWDEDDGSTDEHVATLVISPATSPGAQSPKLFTHYSLLRTTEEMLGVRPFLGSAATAASMRKAFRL